MVFLCLSLEPTAKYKTSTKMLRRKEKQEKQTTSICENVSEF